MSELDTDMRGMKANRRPRMVGIRKTYTELWPVFDCTDPDCGYKFCIMGIVESTGDGPYDDYDCPDGVDWMKQGNPSCDWWCPRCGKPAKVRMSAASALDEEGAKAALGEE